VNSQNPEYRKQLNDLLNKNENFIIDSYVNKNIPISVISKQLNVKRYMLWTFLKRKNINIRQYMANKYSVDESYFEKIDTHEKSYWLGILFSDGYIDEKTYTIGVSLHPRDKELLEKFKKCLKSDAPIKIYKNSGYEKSISRKNLEISRFRFKNKKMVKDLTQFGLKQNKSLTLEFPKIEEKFIYSFMRGYIDGDGCICIYNRKDRKNQIYKSFCLVVIGAEKFIKSMLEFFKKDGVEFSVRKAAHCEHTYHAATSNKDNVMKILDKLYENDEGWIHMERKYQKYLQIKEFHKNNPVNPKMVTSNHYSSVLN